MATQRPSLTVTAAPVSTYVTPGAVPLAGVELYNQQTVNLALQFSDAFKDLSLTAASFAANLRQQENKEMLEAGRDMVNQSQKSYMDLVRSGEISPAENPWMAVGAQEASGTVQGMKARAQFAALYEQKSREDPKFFESSDSFNALASSYAQEMNNVMGDAAYMSRSFYEAFNPYIASMSMKHEEKIVEDRRNKMLIGVSAEVAKTVQDLGSQDPIIRETAASVLQERMDHMGQVGLGFQETNRAVIDNLVALMTTSDEPEKAEKLLNSLKSGTDLLSNTDYAKAVIFQNQGKIEANRNRMTAAESRQFYEWWQGKREDAISGKISQKQLLDEYTAYTEGPERKITLSANEIESKRSWILSDLEQGKFRAERQREEDNKNELLKFINTRASQVDLTVDGSTQLGRLEDAAENMMNRMGFTEEQKMSYRGLIGKTWADQTQRRQEEFVRETTNQLWQGTPTMRGLSYEIQEQFSAFLNPEPNANDPSDSALTTPSFEDWHSRITQTREIQGIPSGTPEAKSADRMDHMRLSSMLDQMEASADLRPKDTDTPDQKFDKSMLRGRYKFLKLNLDRAFGQRTESTKIVNQFVANLDPSRVQAGGMTWPMEDYLRAFTMYRQRNLPMEDLFPQGPYGEAVMEELEWAADQYEAGNNVTDIVADLASLKSVGRSVGINPFEIKGNPLGWARWITKTDDREDFNNKVGEFVAGNEIANTDAYIYVASEFKQEYLANLAATKNHADAMEAAGSAVAENNVMFRGSMIPKRGLPREAQDPAYLAAWMDTMFPGKNATLVVIQRNFDGSVLMAPRDANGSVVTGGRAINSKELGVRPAAQIKQFGENLKRAQNAPPQTKRERILFEAQERVFNPMIPLP